MSTDPEAEGGGTLPVWPIDPDHGMNKGPGYLGDAPHSLRTREVFKYFQPPAAAEQQIVAPLNTGEDFHVETPNLAPDLKCSHDPILTCFANLTCRMLDAKRCIVTMTGAGLSYVIAEATRSISLHYPHTHEPGDQLFLGGGSATASMDGLCEHTVSLLPPSPDSNEPFLLEIPDLRRHPKYAGAGYVRGWPHARFYAGAPMRTKNGVSIGTVCVMDDKTRYTGLTPAERAQLSTMADTFMSYLETKQADSEVNRSRLMEMELSRFIAEGVLPDDGAAMVERRDGRLWSEKILADRRKREIDRRKLVEERRQALQERQFALMLKREKERIARESVEASLTNELEVAQVLEQSPGEPRAGTYRAASEVKIESWKPAEGKIYPESSESTQDEPAVCIAHTRPLQPGIIQIELPKIPSMELDIPLMDMIVEGPQSLLKEHIPNKLERPGFAHHQKRSPSDETITTTRSTTVSESLLGSIASSKTDYNEIATDDLPFGETHSVPETRLLDSTTSGKSSRRRRSNYEQTASAEPHFRAMFSRAASLIRNALNAEVVFVDSDLEGFFGPDGESQDDNSPCTERKEWPASHVSSDPAIEVAARARRSKSHRRRSGILGYATSGGSSSSRSKPDTRLQCVEELGFDVSELTEATLMQVAKENAIGQIITHVDPYPGLEDVDRPALEATETILQRFLPRSKSVIVIPLYDYNKRIFAIGFAWTRLSTRVFCGDVEGRFVTGVGNSIMGEVTRLNILNADKAKGQFISSISHELRSPLHGILASADFLAESRLDPNQRPFLDTIVSCGTTLLDTVNHVLDFQKLNVLPELTNSEDPEKALDSVREESASDCSDTSSVFVGTTLFETDMSDMVQDVIEGVSLGYKFQGFSHYSLASTSHPTTGQVNAGESITVIVDIDPREDGWSFLANSAAYKRIINNLVGNAFKYNKQSGWIRVHLTSEDTSPDKRGNKRAIVSLTVSDSGKGISREFLKTKLFTPFAQENPLSSGAGLGMSIVRQIVGLMGGKIDVKSTIGMGTQVTVETVLVHKQQATAPLAVDIPNAHGRKIRLLGLEPEDATNTTEHSIAALALLKDSLTTCATRYFGMDIIRPSSRTPPDIILANELTSLTLPTLHKLHAQHPRAGIMIMCNRITPNMPPISPNTPTFAPFFLRKPLCPKKFARALYTCLPTDHTPTKPNFRIPLPPPSPAQCVPSNSGIVTQTPTSTTSILALSTPIQPLTTQTDDFFSVAHIPSQPAVMESMSNSQHHTEPPVFSSPPDQILAPPTGKPRVLAVEDNHINMMLLTTYLKKNGYSFAKAVDGQEAVDRVEASGHAFEVILMDLQMPVLSGIEATRKIREMERERSGAKVFVVVLTGLAGGNDRREAFEAGVDAFMVKPVNFKVLSGLLEKEWLKRKDGKMLGMSK